MTPGCSLPVLSWPNARLGRRKPLLAAALAALSVITHHNASTVTGEQIAITVSFAAVGAIVARRQPRNAIGWLPISPVICALLGFDAGLYAVLDYRLGHRLPFGPVAVLLYQAWLPTYVLFPLLILLFPDGRLLSPRWRWVPWSYLGLCSAFLRSASGRVVVSDQPVADSSHLTAPEQTGRDQPDRAPGAAHCAGVTGGRPDASASSPVTPRLEPSWWRHVTAPRRPLVTVDRYLALSEVTVHDHADHTANVASITR